MKKVVGIKYQVDAQRIPDQLAVERTLVQIDQAMFEVPDIPQKGRFIKSPLRHTGDMGGQVRYQRPGEGKAQDRIEDQHKGMLTG